MTIAARRRTYWALFFAACACLATFFLLYLQLPGAEKSPTFAAKAGAFGSFRLGGLSVSSQLLAAGGTGLCALYSALCLGFILYSFRKTVSTEIWFFAFWVLSVGLEVLRLGVFRIAVDEGSAYWQLLATRALLFARYSGYLSLFVSGLYAAGFRNEKLGSAIAIVLAISLGLAAAMPIDTGVYASTLELKPGYSEIDAILVLVASLVTVADYLYAASSTGEASYRLVALGTAAFIAGERLLATQWNPFAMLGGFVLLVSGSWLFVSRLHAYYLWQ